MTDVQGDAEVEEATILRVVDRPLVTFALFAYNQEPYIREAVEGAFAQTYEGLEIILSDDCSTDRTFQIMQEMAADYRGSHAIVLNRNPSNLGKDGFALHVNRVVELSKGKLLIFAGGDDVSAPHRAKALVEIWENAGKPAGALYSAAKILSDDPDKNGRVIFCNAPPKIESIADYIIKGNCITGATAAYARDIFIEFAPLPKGLSFEDNALEFRSILLGGRHHCEEPLVNYRMHDSNLGTGIFIGNHDRFTWWRDNVALRYFSYLKDYTNFVERNGRLLDAKVIIELGKAIDCNEGSRGLISENFGERLLGAYKQFRISGLGSISITTIALLFRFERSSFLYKLMTLKRNLKLIFKRIGSYINRAQP